MCNGLMLTSERMFIVDKRVGGGTSSWRTKPKALLHIAWNDPHDHDGVYVCVCVAKETGCFYTDRMVMMSAGIEGEQKRIHLLYLSVNLSSKQNKP